MTDLRERFDDFRDVAVPELWDRIERAATAPGGLTLPTRRWTPAAAAATAAAVVLLLVGGFVWLLLGDSPDPVVDEPVPTSALEGLPTLTVPQREATPTPTEAPFVTEAPPTPTTQGSRPAPATTAPSPPTTMSSPVMVRIPDVGAVVEEFGDWREAVDIIAAAGFEVRVTVLHVPLEERESEGLVAYIEPEAGTLAPERSTVVLGVYADVDLELIGAKPAGEWTTFTKEDGLASDCVSGGVDISPDGTVWVGCTDGLSRFDGDSWAVVSDDVVCASLAAGASGEVWILACNTASDYEVLRFAGGAWTSYVTIPMGELAVGPDRSVWIAGGPVWRFDGDAFTAVEMPEVSLWEITVGGDGVVWAVGQEAGLWRYDGEWIGAPDDRPEYISADLDGRLWAGYEGVSVYDGDTWHDKGLPDVRVIDFAFAPDGTVWVVSERSGAFRYDGTGWAQYTTGDGLAGGKLTSVAVAPDGSVWFGTVDSGVSRFVPG